MQVVVLANSIQKEEWHCKEEAAVVWIREENEFLQHSSADAFIDLEYINTPERNALLAQLLPKPVIINSVTNTLPETNPLFVRMNGWDTFLSSPVVEAACESEDVKTTVQEVFSLFEKRPEWLPDEPGFITPRVVSLIINEAYLALGEGVSSKEEIDTAMQLGTNYPFGPFAWAEKIGVQNIVTLLQKLSRLQKRYAPSEWLVQETNRAI